LPYSGASGSGCERVALFTEDRLLVRRSRARLAMWSLAGPACVLDCSRYAYSDIPVYSPIALSGVRSTPVTLTW
jgi:hypothetical protein